MSELTLCDKLWDVMCDYFCANCGVSARKEIICEEWEEILTKHRVKPVPTPGGICELLAKKNMREIKFRAWDNILNKMVSVEHIVWKGGEIVQILAGGILVIGAALKRFTLLQCTGIKDCNRKEIYRGNIVLGSSGVEYQGRFEHNEIKVIELNRDCLVFLEECNILKIIGNKYENPELIPGEGKLNANKNTVV